MNSRIMARAIIEMKKIVTMGIFIDGSESFSWIAEVLRVEKIVILPKFARYKIVSIIVISPSNTINPSTFFFGILIYGNGFL